MDYDLNEQSDEKNISRINAAGLINITIEKLWNESYVALSNGNLVGWNRKLDAVWCVLGGDVKEGGDEDKEFNKIDLKLHELGSLNHKKVGFERMSENESGIIAQQYIWLRKKSLFLRRLQNDQGKGTAYARDDDDEM